MIIEIENYMAQSQETLRSVVKIKDVLASLRPLSTT